ncbi:MAG TPA: hypothetical protein VKV74_03140 [Bryobacteraceae bacterium]|nr:hypothetical protein [Bryobacteraceae bacterium]
MLICNMRLVRQFLAAGLVLVFGPAPVAALLAPPETAECRMACCKRKHEHHCSNSGGASEAGSASLAAGAECGGGCLRAAAAAGAKTSIVLAPARLGETPRETSLIAAAGARITACFTDPFLYQRPPPILSL